MHVTLRWAWLEDESAPEWNTSNCLFAFADPESDEILFLGTATGSTVRERCEAGTLEPMWTDLRGIGIDHVSVLVGKPDTVSGEPIAARTLSDAAALLVAELQPSGNAPEADTAAPAAGFQVECAGDWPYEESSFVAT